MKKFLLKSLSLFLLLVLLAPSAQAFSYPSPTKAAGKIMKKYGFSTAEMKNAAKVFNVSRQKKTPPQVALTFAPQNPAEGEQITAIAAPTYFLNDPSNLFYTWFLQHKTGAEPGSDSEGRKTKDGNTDWNEDGSINIEDYKIEAMRIVANGGFDWNKALGKDNPKCQTSDAKPSYCSLDNQYSVARSDDDGYKAPMGGDDQRGKTAHCYYHNVKNGNEYELLGEACEHVFADTNGNGTVGDDDFGKDEELFWRTDPNNADTAGTGNPDEANASGLGISQFTWNYQDGDRLGLAVEGVSTEPTQQADASYKTMWAMSQGKCAGGSLQDEPGTDKIVTTTTVTKTASDNPIVNGSTFTTSTVVVKNHYRLLGMDETSDYSEDPFADSNYSTEAHDSTTTPREETTEAATIGASTDKVVTTTTVTEIPDYDSINGIVTTQTTTSITIDTYVANNTIPPITYPDTPSSSTTPTSSTDEDTTYLFSANDDTVNECLENNLIEPSMSSPSKKLDVSLSYSPKNPLNDSSNSGLGDLVSVAATVNDVQDKNYLRYKWEIYMGNSLALDADWGDPLLKSAIPEAGPMTGGGLSEFNFRLGFKNPKKYLKVKLAVSEAIKSNVANEGRAEVIIPLNSSANKIKLYQTAVSDNLVLSFDTNKERCKNGTSSSACPVAKNEIVALKANDIAGNGNRFTNFSWKVDGILLNPFSYDDATKRCLFGECDSSGAPTSTAYIPILKSPGEFYTIELSADNSAGDKMNLTKTLAVINPEIVIVSEDTAAIQPAFLGFYVDPINKNPNPVEGDETLWPDYSEKDFEVLSGAKAKLKATFSGLSLETAQWFIDGIEINNDTAGLFGAKISSDNALSFSAAAKLGTIYTVSAKSLYTQSDNAKKLLNQYWGLQMNSFYEKEISSEISVKVVDFLPGMESPLSAQPQNKKFLASLISAAPGYISFLFKIIMTTLIILLFSGTILSFFPKLNEE